MTIHIPGSSSLDTARTGRTFLGGHVRRDRLDLMLLALSALGVVLNGAVFPRLGRAGGILQQATTGILFGRALQFTGSGRAHRQRLLPRFLTLAELLADGVATLAGFWTWVRRPMIRGRTSRTARLSRAFAVGAFTLHTVRQAIYLTPSRGLRRVRN